MSPADSADPSPARHVFLGSDRPERDAERLEELWRRIEKLSVGQDPESEGVLWTRTQRLDGARGPTLVVYPEGTWHREVDLETLEKVHRSLLPGSRSDAATPKPEGATPKPDGATPKADGASPKPDGKDYEEVESYRRKVRKMNKKKGLLIVNTGNGKGKTTAALGIGLRSMGRKMPVGIVQFLKREGLRTGEQRAGASLGIDWIGVGDGWTWTSKDIDETEARALRGWEVAREKIQSGEYRVLILDEFTYLMHFGWLDAAEVVAWLEAHKPEDLHLIITGRNAPQELLDLADLVTEMRQIKHPYREQGIKAQPGIEY
ncbi:MAG: cob(I)yrinic acid a,c-diamide adenosyltransferase [Acidobacteriota bacterium]